MISFLLESFLRISWISSTRLIFAWIYFQGWPSWICLQGLIFEDEFKFFFYIFHVTSKGCKVKESNLTTLLCVVGIGLVEEEILNFPFNTLHLVIAWPDSWNFILGFTSPYVSTHPGLVAVSLLEEEIFRF